MSDTKVEEFWSKVDAIDIDSRADSRYTEDEIYDIGCAFIQLNNSQKRQIGGWNKLVEILQPLDKDGKVMTSGEPFRLQIKNKRYAKDEVTPNVHLLSDKTIDDLSFDEFQEKAQEIKRDLYKQEVKAHDERMSIRRSMRDEARIEKMQSLMEQAIARIPELPKVEYTGNKVNESNEAVMLISDMHIGMKINNFANKYDTDVAWKRLMAYVDETIRLCQDNHVKRLNVSNLNDAIHGIIHVTARIEEEEDVIDQVITASEYLAEALVKLQKAAPEVIYRSVTDNHSRVVADYREHIEKESFCKLIDFYLKARLKDSNIVFAHDNLDVDISKFKLMNGKLMVCSHGHRDNINQILQNYMGATRSYIDYVCIGHYHESKMKSFQGAKVIVNGSLCGCDSYAASKRLYGDPEQTLIIFSGNTLSLHIVNLKDIK
jgi:hypothetical protein